MSTALQLRRGTTSQHTSFTGLSGEVTVDSTKHTVVVHDGTTAGGYPLLRQDISNLENATIGISKLNVTGTPSGATYLRGDGTWGSPTVSAFPSGTLMLFQQTAAPTGWTKQTTHNDKALRVVSGTASSGGTSAFSTVFTNQTPTIDTSGLSAGATTLSTAQMPSHNHSYTTSTYDQEYVLGYNTSGQAAGGTSGSTGGGGSHTHSIAGSATSSAITLNVQYVDLIIASKD